MSGKSGNRRAANVHAVPSEPTLIEIDEPADPRLADYTGLTDVALRRVREPAEGLFLAEGANVVLRAMAAGFQPRSLLLLRERLDREDVRRIAHDVTASGAPAYVADAQTLGDLTGFNVHRGVLAAFHRKPSSDVAAVIRDARRVAVFEDIVDHTNLGAAFRSAAALGIDAVLITPRCADPLYRRAVRVSMGTVFDIPWTRLAHWPQDVGLLREAGFTVAALALGDDAISLDTFASQRHPRLALVFGTEGDGLRPRTVAATDVTVRIPMSGGVDSLNVAAAAAVVFYATRLS
jgi:tRNA G18 (ribose-2'-O)-methylase SpoU